MGLIFAREKGFLKKLIAVFFSVGVQAIIIYRLSSFFRRYKITKACLLHLFFYRLNQFLCNVDIDPGAKIGRNFLMPHATGVIIGGTAEIGDNVTIMHGVTIGARKIGEKGNRHAKIGNNVFIGPNAVILGDIEIADKAEIAANSVVLKNVNKEEKVFGIYK